MKVIISGTELKGNLIYVGVMLDDNGESYHLVAKNKDEKGLFNWHEVIEPRDEFVCPTSKELNLMRTIAEKLGMTEWYWASTEYSDNSAWVHRFSDGYQNNSSKFVNYLLRYVRRVDDLELKNLTPENKGE